MQAADVTPERFIHLFRPTRVDRYHGVSILKPVMPHARDLYELFGYEKIAAKFAASFAGFIQTSDPYSPDGANTWDTPKKGNSPATMEAMAGTMSKVNISDLPRMRPVHMGAVKRPSNLVDWMRIIEHEIDLLAFLGRHFFSHGIEEGLKHFGVAVGDDQAVELPASRWPLSVRLR